LGAGDLLNIVITEILKLKRTFILWVGVLMTAVIPFLTLAMNLEREISFIDFGKSSLTLSIFLLFPCLYALVATFIFNREYQEDTIKNLMCVPISRYRLAVAKFIVMLLYFFILLILHGCLSALLAALLGCPGMTIQNFFNILFLNIRTLLPYAVTMLPIFGIIIISRKSYLISLGFGVAITITNVVIASSKFAALYPWTAVYRFCGDIQGTLNFNFTSSIWLSTASLFACFAVGLFMIIFSLPRQEY
jgi:bacitracin transport system permease protein